MITLVVVEDGQARFNDIPTSAQGDVSGCPNRKRPAG
jgi:hypothetical protein